MNAPVHHIEAGGGEARIAPLDKGLTMADRAEGMVEALLGPAADPQGAALAGEAGAKAPAPMMERMASRIPSAEYVCLPGAGHLGNLENPAAFNRALANFLQKWSS